MEAAVAAATCVAAADAAVVGLAVGTGRVVVRAAALRVVVTVATVALAAMAAGWATAPHAPAARAKAPAAAAVDLAAAAEETGSAAAVAVTAATAGARSGAAAVVAAVGEAVAAARKLRLALVSPLCLLRSLAWHPKRLRLQDRTRLLVSDRASYRGPLYQLNRLSLGQTRG